MSTVDYGDRFECPTCGAVSACAYRCDTCGHDLAGDSTATSTSRMEASR